MDGCKVHSSHVRLGQREVQVFEGAVEPENARHEFVDKQIISVTIPSAYLDATTNAIPYSYCEVYGPREEMSNVCIVAVAF